MMKMKSKKNVKSKKKKNPGKIHYNFTAVRVKYLKYHMGCTEKENHKKVVIICFPSIPEGLVCVNTL